MTPRYPSNFQQKTLWNALTGVAILIIGLLLASLIWMTGKVFGLLQPVLIPLAVAGITAYLLDPIVSWLQKKGLSRLKSVMAVFASFIVVIAVFGAIIIPPLASQISDTERRQNLQQNVVKLGTTLKETPWVTYWLEKSEKAKKLNSANGIHHPGPESTANGNGGSATEADNTDDTNIDTTPVSFNETRLADLLPADIMSISAGWVKGGTSKVLGYLGLIIGFAMMPIYLYYFLKEGSGIKAHWHEYIPLKASRFKTEVVETLGEINGYLISFFRGQMLVAFIDGILVGIALWAFGLPYGLVIGMFMAILGVIPYIGNMLCLVPACIIAYVHFGLESNQFFLGDNAWIYVGAVCAIFFIVQQINSLVTAPKIVGDSVGLHPMTVIFSMLFWSILLGGFIGALLAVPLTAAIKVLFRRYLWEPRMADQADQTPA